MSTDLPIACALSAGELTQRLAEMADLGGDALIETELTGTSATLRFAAGRGIRQRLARIVAAESECCAFLTLAVREETDVLALSITAPAGAEPAVRELVDAFRGVSAGTASA
jgi:hypothetical protein